MKNNIFIYFFAAFIVITAGCKKDFLEEKSDFGGTNEEVFKDPLLAQGYVDYVYGLFMPANNGTGFIQTNSASEDGTFNNVFTQTTEELAGETDYNKVWASVLYTNNHANKYFGQRMTAGIRNNTWTRLKQINIFIAEIDKYGLPENTRNVLKGQMYFWRAWQYFELVRLYGGVPLVLVPQNPIADANGENAVPRSKTSTSIDQICADLDMAKSLLPGKWTSSADWGRITSGAAAALKGRVLLTWASPLFNRQDDLSRWERAYTANLEAKTLLEQNGFGLFKTGGTADGKAWGDMWLSESGNPEAVMVYGFNNLAIGNNTTRNSGWEQATRSKEISGAGSISPTKQMVDAFPMKDGKMPGDNTSAYTYDPNKFYKNRDPRFYKTFVYNGALWPYAGATTYKQWTYVWKKAANATFYNATTETRGANSSGIYLCKANNPTANNSIGHFSQSGTDYMEIRFAEVILNLAESAIGAGKLTEGLDGIKAIRERAGIENADGNYGLSASSGNRDKLFAAVLNERKVEFAYENKRFFDLRRWMLFEEGSTTAARLGMPALNGTRRTGFVISVKTLENADFVGSNDPMLAVNGTAPLINRDPASYPPGITTYDQYLDFLYDNYFKITVKDDLDKTNVNPSWTFKWYPEYYFFGLHQNVLTGSPYLEQTIGWNSLQGSGTFDPLK